MAVADSLFRPDTADNEEVTFTERANYVIFNHGSTYYDQPGASRDGTLRLLEIIRRSPERYRSMVAVDPAAIENRELGERYYVRSDDVDLTSTSYSGAHRISLPNAETLIFSGGNLSMCLCESIRDFIRRRTNPGDNLDVVLVADAIYDFAFWNPTASQAQSHQTLERLLGDMTDVMAEYYFQNEVIGTEKMCPNQDFSDEPDVDPREYSFVIKRNGRVWRTIGSGPRRVTLHISRTQEFESTMDELTSSLVVHDSDRSVGRGELGEQAASREDAESVGRR